MISKMKHENYFKDGLSNHQMIALKHKNLELIIILENTIEQIYYFFLFFCAKTLFNTWALHDS